MVFDSANTAGRKVILTEIESRGNNFVVVLSAELKGNKISVNDIRSLYPKDSVQGIIDWINAGNLLKYVDKNKALEWIGKQQSNSAEVTNTIKNLDVATKLLQNFENPAIIEQKNEKNLKEHRLDHQRGYTSNNGKYFSINAEGAMIDGKFPKIEFCKVYGLKKKVFDFLVDLGIIYTDGEWHIFNTQSPTGKPVTVIFHNSTIKQLGEGARGADYAVAVECWRKVSEEEAKHIATYLNSIGYGNFKNYNDSQASNLQKI